MSDLADIQRRRIEAEDRHGRVFATACTKLEATTDGKDLVTAWLVTYREMELLRKMELQLTANGKLAEQPADKSARAPLSALISPL